MKKQLCLGLVGTTTRLFGCALLGGMLASACGGSTEGVDLGSSEEDILNGTLPPAGTAEAQGHVQITSHGCSATLIRNDMVLTARHCVTTNGTIAGPVDVPGNFTLVMGTQTRGASRIFANVTTNDTALIQLSNFFVMSGKRFDYNRAIYTGTDASLLGATVACYGYGYNTCANTGAGTLRTANLLVASTTATHLSYNNNGLGQNLWKGDSGGSCFSGANLVGVTSTGVCAGTTNQQGAQSFRPWAMTNLLTTSASTITTATAGNTTGNTTILDNPDANGNAAAIVQVTANWNPPPSAGVYNVHPVGVKYQAASLKWSVQNKDGVNMPLGAAYNVSAGGNSFVHTTSAASISGHLSRIDNVALNALPGQVFVMTPNESGTANNHATGVFYDAAVSKWSVYNEDVAAMPVGAKFNIRVVTSGDPAFNHTATFANILGPWTYLDNVNLNNQPSAQMFVTHDYGASGFGGVAVNAPLGVFYDAPAAKWAIFTQDGSPMPLNAKFKVLIRP